MSWSVGAGGRRRGWARWSTALLAPALLGLPFLLDVAAPDHAERLVGRWEGDQLRLQLSAGGRFALEGAGLEPLRGSYLLDVSRTPAAISFVVPNSPNLHTSFALEGDDTLVIAGPPFSPARQLRPVSLAPEGSVVLRRTE